MDATRVDGLVGEVGCESRAEPRRARELSSYFTPFDLHSL